MANVEKKVSEETESTQTAAENQQPETAETETTPTTEENPTPAPEETKAETTEEVAEAPAKEEVAEESKAEPQEEVAEEPKAEEASTSEGEANEEEVPATEEPATAEAESTEEVAEEAPAAEADADPDGNDIVTRVKDEEVGRDDEEGEELNLYEGVEQIDTENFDWESFEQGAQEYTDTERADLDSMYDDTLNAVQQGEVVKGTVVDITKKEVVVNINYKSEGIVTANEFRYNEDLKIGDTVDVYVESLEDKNGQLDISHKTARMHEAWRKVNVALEEDTIITGNIKCRTKGGLIADVFGLEAFLPGSQIDVKPIRDYDIYVGKNMEFKINTESTPRGYQKLLVLTTPPSDTIRNFWSGVDPQDYLPLLTALENNHGYAVHGAGFQTYAAYLEEHDTETLKPDEVEVYCDWSDDHILSLAVFRAMVLEAIGLGLETNKSAWEDVSEHAMVQDKLKRLTSLVSEH